MDSDLQQEWITSTKHGRQPAHAIYLYVQTEVHQDSPTDDRRRHRFQLATALQCSYHGQDCVSVRAASFNDPADLWEWLERHCRTDLRTWIVCHNAGIAVVCIGALHLIEQGYKLNWCVDRDPPTLLEMQLDSGATVLFADIRNYIDAPLDSIGGMIGVPVGDRPKPWAPDAQQWAYSKHCCLVIRLAFEYLRQYHETHRLGNWSYTISGMSLAAWRHRLGRMPVNKTRPDHVKLLERRGYYAPPVEVYRYGEFVGRCYLLDVTSMFPAIMHQMHVPRELYASGFGRDSYHRRFGDLGRNTMASVLVNASDRQYPVRLADGTYFAIGRYWTILCGLELQDACIRGDVEDVGTWAVYELCNQFRDYVEYFYPMKSASKAASDRLGLHLAKKLLVSLHGKLAQRKSVWVDTPRLDSDPLWGEWQEYNVAAKRVVLHRAYPGKVQFESDIVEGRYSFPAISAWITSYVREHIRRLVRIAGERQVLYVVSDGMIVTEEGYRNLLQAGKIGSGKLGGLEVQSYSEGCRIETIGNYHIGEVVRHGGYVNPPPVNSGTVVTERVTNRLSSAIRMGPSVGVLEYSRTRNVFASNRRQRSTTSEWTVPPMIHATSDSFRVAVETGNKLPGFDSV